jgi:peroxiredoxin
MDLNESFSLFGFVTRNEACRRRVMEEIRWVKFFPAGEAAPNFTLHVTPDQLLSLNDLKGKPMIMALYPADWSPVCSNQMALYKVLSEFRKHEAELLGISVDVAWCHQAFAKDRHLHFPLLADF